MIDELAESLDKHGFSDDITQNHILGGIKKASFVIVRTHQDENRIRKFLLNEVNFDEIPIAVIKEDKETDRLKKIVERSSLVLVHNQRLQFVMISVRPDDAYRCIVANEQKTDFIKEWVIITNKDNIAKIKDIPTKTKIIAIDESSVIGPEYYSHFAKLNHMQKNWLLRVSAMNSELIDDEFIFIDDDHLPLIDIKRDYYINKKGRHILRYMNDMANWNRNYGPFDDGERNALNWLRSRRYEHLMYAIHAPQIISKKIFQEAIKEISYNLGDAYGEWEIYCNYITSNYPMLVIKKPFETLMWPLGNVDDINSLNYLPSEFAYENHYTENVSLMDIINQRLSYTINQATNIALNYYVSVDTESGEKTFGNKKLQFIINHNKIATVNSDVFCRMKLRGSRFNRADIMKIYEGDRGLAASEIGDWYDLSIPVPIRHYGKNTLPLMFSLNDNEPVELTRIEIKGV